MLGNYAAFGILMSNLLTPFGLNVTQISLLGVLTVFCGLIGAVFMAFFLDKTRMYKNSLIFFSCSTVICLTLLTFITMPNASTNFPMLVVNASMMGFLAIPIIPLCLTFSTEVTHPMSPSLANGLCQFFA